MSVNGNFLRGPAWTGIIRAVRKGTLGLILLVVLALPFPAAAWTTTGTALTPRSPLPCKGEGETGGLLPLSAPERGLGGEVDFQTEADARLTTLERLLATPRPVRDPVALASQLAGSPVPWTATQPYVGPLQAGRQDTFYVLDQRDNQYKPRPATLRLVSQEAYWYVQDDKNMRDEDLAASAQQFDEQVVPTVRRLSGTEWLPGIDGDPRMTIFLGDVPGVSAYFSSWDEYPRSVFRYSNEREMFHVDFRGSGLTASSLNGTLAHELQHMIAWRQSPATDTWLDEGLAEVANSLVTSGSGPGTGRLQRQPNVQLTTWAQGSENSLHYQASYLFSRYFVQRFGEAAVRQLLSEQARPPDSITAYLSRAGHGITFDDLFEDWIVANLLDDPSVGDGSYAHDGIEHRAPVGLTLSPDGRPAEQTVRQFGAQYIELRGDGGDAELLFAGAPTVRLVGADATSGRGLWWSNRADGLDSSLTRRFDLTNVAGATLRFNLWYDTERDFDFLYVLASTDGGKQWRVLHGASADDTNPTGNAIGPGYSGTSGVSNGQRGEPAWIAESVDLTPLAGGEVLIRFEYVTDQGYNARGVLIDDVEVPEIGFRDDAETDGDWTAAGFLRSENVIPQTWSLQLVEYEQGGQTHVRPLRADAAGQVVERIGSLGGQVERAVLVVSGLAPRTLEAAPFQVTLRPAP